MIKTLINTLVVACAIQAISITNVTAQTEDDAFKTETATSPAALQSPDRVLSKQELSNVIYELNISFGRLSEQLEQANTNIDATNVRQQKLDETAAALRRDLGRLNLLLENLANDASTVAEDLNKSNKASSKRHSEIIALINDANGQISILLSQASDAKQAINLNDTRLDELDKRITGLSSSLGNQVSEVEKSVEDGFLSIKTTVLFRTLTGGLIFIAFAIVLVLVRRQFFSRHQVLSAEFSDSSAALHSEYNNLDLKLSELLSKQLNEIDANTERDDHTLPLQVAAEIHRMRKRIERMPKEIKDVKPLEKALERLEEGLDSKGYEIIDLLGEKFVEGLNVNPRFNINENLDPDTQIITKVIKPQVNYAGKIIQIADVEVSMGNNHGES